MNISKKLLNSAIKNMLRVKSEQTLYANDYMQKIKNSIHVIYNYPYLRFEVVDGFRIHRTDIEVNSQRDTDKDFDIVVNITDVFKSKEKNIDIYYDDENGILKFTDLKITKEYKNLNFEYFNINKVKEILKEKEPIFEICVTPRFLIDALQTFTEDNTPTTIKFYGKIDPIVIIGVRKTLAQKDENFVLPIKRN